ncbi:MAG: hypothetical protein ACLGG9_10015, partial [Thermoleophilia bacterium]
MEGFCIGSEQWRGVKGGVINLGSGETVTWGWWSNPDEALTFTVGAGVRLPSALWAMFLSPSLGLQGRVDIAERGGLAYARRVVVEPGTFADDGGTDAASSIEEALPILPVAEIIRESIGAAAEALAGDEVPNARQEALRGLHKRAKSVERQRAQHHLWWVAHHYRAEVEAAAAEGRRARPVEVVNAHFPDKSTRTIARWISECRRPEVALLPPTTQGRPHA